MQFKTAYIIIKLPSEVPAALTFQSLFFNSFKTKQFFSFWTFFAFNFISEADYQISVVSFLSLNLNPPGDNISYLYLNRIGDKEDRLFPMCCRRISHCIEKDFMAELRIKRANKCVENTGFDYWNFEIACEAVAI